MSGWMARLEMNVEDTWKRREQSPVGRRDFIFNKWNVNVLGGIVKSGMNETMLEIDEDVWIHEWIWEKWWNRRFIWGLHDVDGDVWINERIWLKAWSGRWIRRIQGIIGDVWRNAGRMEESENEYRDNIKLMGMYKYTNEYGGNDKIGDEYREYRILMGVLIGMSEYLGNAGLRETCFWHKQEMNRGF